MRKELFLWVFFLHMITLASPARASLIAWYPLHGDATAAVGVNGMEVNGPTPVSDQKGNPNGALGFHILPNDSGSYVSIGGGAGLPGLSRGTVAMWVNWSGAQDAAFQNSSFGDVLARQSNTVYSNNVLGINNASPALGKLTWQPYGAGAPVAVGATPVGDNVWHFVAVTFDGVTGAQRLYLDGNLDGSGNATGSLNGDQVAALTIGAWNGDGSGYSSSSIHDVRIFDTVLSQSDLQALQAQDAVPEPTTLALAGLSVLGLLGYGVTRLKSSKGL